MVFQNIKTVYLYFMVNGFFISNRFLNLASSTYFRSWKI